MFQFPSLPRYSLFIQLCVTRHYSGGVAPFGDPRINGYNAFSRLFAVYCVLLRLLMPRYPPCALSSFTIYGRFWSLTLRTRERSDHLHYWWNTDLNMQFSGYGAGIIRPLGWPSGSIPKLGFLILPELLVR